MDRNLTRLASVATAVALTYLPVGWGESAMDAPYRSHVPMRPLPAPSNRPLVKGPAYFVDPVNGDDANAGSEARPCKTVQHALKQLKAGDTLYLRGGRYYEPVTVAVSGTAQKPITLRSYPGELAFVDGGIRDFYEDPSHSWEPFPDGGAGEFRSTKTYSSGGGFGNFADSMIPFHRYLTFADLRSTNELCHATLGNRSDDATGIYAGPGVRRDPQSGRIHIRLAHTKLAGLGSNQYRGETDPRKLRLVIAGRDYSLWIEGARHVRVQDVVVQGAQRAAVLMADSEDIELDGMTIYGGQMALRIGASRNVRLKNSACRGFAAPWHSRFHHKDRAGAGYLVLAAGTDMEFAHCEFTDHHDFLNVLGVDRMQFHHNRVDNFNDDGIEAGPKRESGRIDIYQNQISRCLSPFTLHGKKPAPVKSEAGSGVYIYRNVFDLRQGTYGAPPVKPDPSGAFLNRPTELLAHDHGSPTHPIYYVYHNSFLLQGNAWRGYYGFGWASHTRGTTRRVFNNIFAQAEGLPGLDFTAVSPEDDFQADGNLLWGIRDGGGIRGDYFTKFRQSPLFAASKRSYPPGWGANDRFGDPKFVCLGGDGKHALDLHLQKDSPAIDAGVALPADWPDPLRSSDLGKPDIGALPLGAAR